MTKTSIPKLSDARRNYAQFCRQMSQFHIEEVMQTVHDLSTFYHLDDVPKTFPGFPSKRVRRKQNKLSYMPYPWELEMFLREAIRHSGYLAHKPFREWGSISNLTNLLRKFTNELTPEYSDYGVDVLRELQRIAHRQFPWQVEFNHPLIARHWKIYSDKRLELFIQEDFGCSANEFYVTCFALLSTWANYTAIKIPLEISDLKIDSKVINKISMMFSSAISHSRQEINSIHNFDANYEYRYSPLLLRPLLFSELLGRRLFCPIPYLFLKRMTDGLYYQFVGRIGFSDAIGGAFESYVGEVISAVLPHADRTPEKRIKKTGGEFRTVDWLVEHEGCTLFVECKSKQPTYNAKFDINKTDSLEVDLEKIGTEIGKMYVNLNRYLNGEYPNMTPLGNVYPIFVTLADWSIYHIRTNLNPDQFVRAYLRKRGVDPEIMKSFPVEVCGAEVFEMLLQSIASHGANEVLGKRARGHRRSDFLDAYLTSEFPVNTEPVWNAEWMATLHEFIDQNKDSDAV
ncbi:hypothetical protein [uncultured Maricaulis sp.]|uniref:hypothetical protein n=1 Tax=uncultured Maricaulis sp. TaxID=174710 RepID=UPI0030D9991E